MECGNIRAPINLLLATGAVRKLIFVGGQHAMLTNATVALSERARTLPTLCRTTSH